jgi:hypothetical protein
MLMQEYFKEIYGTRVYHQALKSIDFALFMPV